MMNAYRAKYSDGTLRLLSNEMPDIDDGETVFVTIERVRSDVAHKHQFAWINEAWANIPEHLQQRPWAQTPETLRKHALIATGYHSTYTIDCGTAAAARNVLAALRAAEARAAGYAIGRVTGSIVQIWTPLSQSYRSMGRTAFNESKRAILEWIAAQIGVEPEQLSKEKSNV